MIRKIYRGLEYNKFSLLFILMSVMLLVFLVASCTNHTSEKDESTSDTSQIDTLNVDTGGVENQNELIAQ